MESTNDPMVKAKESYLRTMQMRNEKHHSGEPFRYTARLPSIEKIIHGFGFNEEPKFIVIAGASGVGKTLLSLQVAFGVATCNDDAKVLYITRSEKRMQLLDKIASSCGEVPYKSLLEGSFTGEQFQRSIVAMESLPSRDSEHFLYIEDEISRDPWDLMEHLESCINRYGYTHVFIDYFQLFGDLRQHPSRQGSEFSQILKSIVQSTSCSVIALSQISKNVDQRPGHRPNITDLNHWGSLNEEADQILLLLRREMYDPHDKPGMMEVIVAKNRFGDLGVGLLTLIKETGTIVSYEPKSLCGGFGV